VTAEQRLDVGTLADIHGVELSDHLAAANDREVLAQVFNRVQDVGEIPRSVCRTTSGTESDYRISAGLRHQSRSVTNAG
jgi:hypothetical protein